MWRKKVKSSLIKTRLTNLSTARICQDLPGHNLSTTRSPASHKKWHQSAIVFTRNAFWGSLGPSCGTVSCLQQHPQHLALGANLRTSPLPPLCHSLPRGPLDASNLSNALQWH